MRSLKFILVFVVVVLLFTGKNLIFGKKQVGKPLPAGHPVGLVKLKAEKNEVGFALMAENSSLLPMTMKLTFPELTNLKPSATIPLVVTLPARQKDIWVLDLAVSDATKASNFKYLTELAHGDYEAKHDDNYMYWLPFEHGTKHMVVQGYGGGFSHNRPFSYYAIDFDMEEGTKVLAARDGLVYDVKEDGSRGGKYESMVKEGNYVRIFHKDGTMATYDHLKKSGVEVEVGEKVKAGQLLGYSGNTGYSKGPHLHFAVFVASEKAIKKSIPTEFRTVHGRTKLEVGKSYYASHPGGEAFEDFKGSDVTNEYYQYYSKEVKETNKIELRRETHDRTVVFFVQNGYGRALEIEFSFDELDNMEASKETPVKMIVPRKTEKYVLFARAKTLDAYKYKPQIKYKEAK